MVSGNKLRPINSAALTEHQTPTLTPHNGTQWITKEPIILEVHIPPIKSKQNLPHYRAWVHVPHRDTSSKISVLLHDVL
jgi:hypothetical protein